MLIGTPGRDVIVGSSGHDRIDGAGGDDVTAVCATRQPPGRADPAHGSTPARGLVLEREQGSRARTQIA